MAIACGACAPFRPLPNAYAPRTEAPTAGVPQASVAWPDDAWWTRYQNPDLDRLIDLALAGSPTLDVARARFAIAAAELDTARANTRPELDIGGSASRSHIVAPKPPASAMSSGGAAPPTGGDAGGGSTGAASSGASSLPSWDTALLGGAVVRYQFDFWGAKRNAVAAATDSAHASAADVHAAAWLLAYGVASMYADWDATALRCDIARRTIALDEERIRIVDIRVRRGVDPPQDIENVRRDLAESRQQLAALESTSKSDAASLAALLGIAPAALPPLVARALPPVSAAVPDDVSVGLVERRPDLVASRWRVEAAARTVDVARAAFYPTISVNALAAVLRTYPTPGSPGTTRLFDAGISAFLPLLDGGRIQAQYDTRQRELDEAIAQYNASLVAAASDVARAAVSLEGLGEQKARRSEALGASERALAIVETREHRGVGDPRDTVSAGLERLRQLDAATQIDGQALSAEFGLVRALGGGYVDRDPAGDPLVSR